jgi:hypothetical protein
MGTGWCSPAGEPARQTRRVPGDASRPRPPAWCRLGHDNAGSARTRRRFGSQGRGTRGGDLLPVRARGQPDEHQGARRESAPCSLPLGPARLHPRREITTSAGCVGEGPRWADSAFYGTGTERTSTEHTCRSASPQAKLHLTRGRSALAQGAAGPRSGDDPAVGSGRNGALTGPTDDGPRQAGGLVRRQGTRLSHRPRAGRARSAPGPAPAGTRR